MRSILKTAICGAALITGLGGCATLEPEPCTAQWVDWHKDRIFDDFARRHRGDINALRNLGDDLNDPSVIAAIRLASRIESIGDMAEDFVSVTVPDVQNTLAPCASAGSASELVADMLRREGVGDETVAWVQALGAFMEMQPGLGVES